MTRSALDIDDWGQPIQGALTPETAHSISTSTSSARNSVAFSYRVIRVVATQNTFIALGDSSITATTSDHYLPSGAIEYFVRREYTHIAAILASGTGVLYVSEMA